MSLVAFSASWKLRSEVVQGLTELVPDEEAGDDLGHAVGAVLVHGVAHLGQHLHLEPALHLAHRQLAVQPVHPRQQQQLGPGRRQEARGESLEPGGPVRLRPRQVRPPPVHPRPSEGLGGRAVHRGRGSLYWPGHLEGVRSLLRVPALLLLLDAVPGLHLAPLARLLAGLGLGLLRVLDERRRQPAAAGRHHLARHRDPRAVQVADLARPHGPLHRLLEAGELAGSALQHGVHPSQGLQRRALHHVLHHQPQQPRQPGVRLLAGHQLGGEGGQRPAHAVPHQHHARVRAPVHRPQHRRHVSSHRRAAHVLRVPGDLGLAVTAEVDGEHAAVREGGEVVRHQAPGEAAVAGAVQQHRGHAALPAAPVVHAEGAPRLRGDQLLVPPVFPPRHASVAPPRPSPRPAPCPRPAASQPGPEAWPRWQPPGQRLASQSPLQVGHPGIFLEFWSQRYMLSSN